MRALTITRDRQLNGAGVPFDIQIDGRLVGKIENGRSIRINIDDSSHSINITARMGDATHTGDETRIPAGKESLNYRVYRKVRLISTHDIHLDRM